MVGRGVEEDQGRGWGKWAELAKEKGPGLDWKTMQHCSIKRQSSLVGEPALPHLSVTLLPLCSPLGGLLSCSPSFPLPFLFFVMSWKERCNYANADDGWWYSKGREQARDCLYIQGEWTSGLKGASWQAGTSWLQCSEKSLWAISHIPAPLTSTTRYSNSPPQVLGCDKTVGHHEAKGFGF